MENTPHEIFGPGKTSIWPLRVGCESWDPSKICSFFFLTFTPWVEAKGTDQTPGICPLNLYPSPNFEKMICWDTGYLAKRAFFRLSYLTAKFLSRFYLRASVFEKRAPISKIYISPNLFGRWPKMSTPVFSSSRNFISCFTSCWWVIPPTTAGRHLCTLFL